MSFLRIALVFSSGLFPLAVFAQTATNVDLTPVSPVNVSEGVGGVLCKLAEGIFAIALAAAIIAFLIGAFLFVTAAGNEKRVTQARQAFYYALIGAIVVVLSWGAAFIIAETLTAGSSAPAFFVCP